jgi:hypothetical protein
MAESDLDVVIRSMAKKQIKTRADAAGKAAKSKKLT